MHGDVLVIHIMKILVDIVPCIGIIELLCSTPQTKLRVRADRFYI